MCKRKLPPSQRRPQPDLESRKDREWLLRQNQDEIAHCYLQAAAQGIPNPTIFVFDTDDPVAHEMVVDLIGEEHLRRHEQEMRAQQLHPTVVVALPWSEDVASVLGPEQRQSIRERGPLHPCGYRIVIVGSGGKLYTERYKPRSQENN